MIKRVLITLFVLFNVYAILCGGLYFFQENLIFHPQQVPVSYTYAFDEPYEDIWLDTEDGARLHGLHFTLENPRGILLYFHGNAGSLVQWGEVAAFFVKKGYAVVVMDYRQFGKSSGVLSEKNLYDDSLLWYDFTKEQYPSLPITSYGRSLGTTFASYVASKKQVAQLILETPFYSIEDEAHSRFTILPTARLLKYTFPTYKFVTDLKTSIVTVLHGTEDEVVHYEHGKRLYDAITTRDKEFMTIQGANHHNLIEFTEYRQKIDELLGVR